jgi:hypothetical protein
MRRNRLIGAVAVAALLLTAGVAGAAALLPSDAANAQAQPSADDTGIQVAASGTVEAAPDEAVVRVSVIVEGDNVSEIRSQLADNSSSMRSALEEMGVADVASVDYDIRQNYRAEREGGEEPKYVGRHAFEVTVSNPDRAGDVVVTAVENGATRVAGVEYTLSEETRDQLREQALAEAMQRARSEADVIADESNLNIIGVSNARTGDVHVEPVVRETSYAAVAGDGGSVATTIDAGDVTVRAHVVVSYDASG